MMEVELICLDCGTGEGGGGGQPLAVRPFQESLERPMVGLDGTLGIGAGAQMFEKTRSSCGEGFGNWGRGGGGRKSALAAAAHTVNIDDSGLA